jgi:uncharacterized protein YggT (Ycf19 family)
MTVVFSAIIGILICIMGFLRYLLIAYIILGWFVIFGVLKDRDGWFFRVYVLLMTKIEPLLEIARRLIPPLGGLDFSPLIALFCLEFAKFLMYRLIVILQ